MSPGRPPDEIEPVEVYDPDLDPAVLRRRRELVLTFAALTVILAGCFILAFYMLRTKPVTRRQMVVAAEEAVRDATGRNPTLQLGDAYIDTDGEDLYLLRSEGRMVNADNRPIHFWYYCLLRRTEDGKLIRVQLKIVVP